MRAIVQGSHGSDTAAKSRCTTKHLQSALRMGHCLRPYHFRGAGCFRFMNFRKNLLGMVFNRLTVLRFNPVGTRNMWECQCVCGKLVNVAGYSLTEGITKSCGCFNDEARRSRRVDLSGKVFGRWRVIRYDPGKEHYYICKCVCGVEKSIHAGSLRYGLSTSCGCYRREIASEISVTHGASRVGKHTGAYRSWAAMRARCLDPNNNRYASYAGRGIKVCDRWLHSFENFLADMGERPVGMTIERKDNDGDYCKENCRWATKAEQAVNKRDNHLVTLNGVTKTVSQWTELYGLNPKTVASRIVYGWTGERLFSAASKSHVAGAARRLALHGAPLKKP